VSAVRPPLTPANESIGTDEREEQKRWLSILMRRDEARALDTIQRMNGAGSSVTAATVENIRRASMVK
jgi:hypothetical protein